MPGFTGDYVFTDKRLLTKILHDEFKDHAIKITDLKSTPACKKGDNFISQVQRLQITASNENENTQNFGNIHVFLL